MKRVDSQAIIRTTFSIGVLLVIGVFLVLLVPKLKLKGLRKPSACAKVFPVKSAFVELNGAYSRLSGRRLCNGTCRGSHGLMLTGLKASDVSSEARAAIRFADWLKGQGAKFLYVQAPAKADREGALHPPALRHSGNVMADDFIARLDQAGVETLDLREDLAVTVEDVARQFYRTDHHWNNDAVFTAFGIIAARIAAMTDADPLAVERLTCPAAWNREVWPACFLGSRGRRTGRLFSGADDLIVYTPRFQPQMSLDIPAKDIHRIGSFRQTNMWNAKAIERNGRLSPIAYSALYVGGYYSLVHHRNSAAPIQAKVLIIGDSYTRPLEAFLSTVVSDLTVVDPRRFAKGEAVADHVLRRRPDVVLELINTGGFHSGFIGRKRRGRSVMFDYGLSTADGK